MSLDVYLEGDPREVECICPHCDHAHKRVERELFYNANITHNLTAMAEAAGVYEVVWRPDEHAYTKAWQLIGPLTIGLRELRRDPALFKQYNSKNGWGLYDNFVPWLERYLKACEQYPDANVSVSR